MEKSIIKSLELGLRFETSKGLLSTEQLFKISMSELVDKVHESFKLIKDKRSDDSELDFLKEESKVDSLDELKFEVLKTIYTHRRTILDEAKDSASKKIHNDKINDLIARKREDSLANLSVEELEKLLK